MSGGLLEKAKQASGDSDEDVGAAADAVIEEKTVPNPSENPIMLYAAAGSLAVCMVLLYFMYLLPAYSGAIIFLMVIGSAYLASLHVKNTRNNGGALNNMQWASIAVVYLLLAGIPYVAAMDLGGSVLLNYDSNDWIDEDSDTVTLDLRQSTGLLGTAFEGGDVQVTVSQDGSETWSGAVSVTMNSGLEGNSGELTLAIADFYSMNAQRVKSFTGTGTPVMEDHPYTVCVDVDGMTDCADLPTFELTRNVTDVDSQAIGYDDTQEDCSGNHETCIDYIEIQGWVGEGSASTDSNTVPARISGTYMIDMTMVYEDGTETVSYSTITVDNNVASWEDDTCGNGPMSIGASTTDFYFQCDGDNRFDRDHALSEEYGCYTLTISAWTEGSEIVSTTSHYEFTEEQGEGSGNPGEPSGTYYWEEFNAVSSC